MDQIIKNKKILIAGIGIILIIICIVAISSGSGDIYGEWEVSAKSTEDIGNMYPEDNFVLYENGTVTADGYSGSYSMNDKTITMKILWETYTFEYKVSGDTLMLKNIEEDKAKPAIYYDRVK